MLFRRRSSNQPADDTGYTRKDFSNYSVDINNMDNSYSRTWEPPIDYMDNMGFAKKWPWYERHQKQVTGLTATSSDAYETDDKPKTISNVLSRFAERTAMQGPSNINNSKTWYAKLIWTTLFLGALSGMIFHLNVLVRTYIEFSKQTKVQLGFSSIALPTVTFCNVNPVKFSKLKYAQTDLRRFVERIRPEKVAFSLKERRPPPPPAPGQEPPSGQNQPQGGNHVPNQNPPSPSKNGQGHNQPQNSHPVQLVPSSGHGQSQTQSSGLNSVQSSPPPSSSDQRQAQTSSAHPVHHSRPPTTDGDQSHGHSAKTDPVQTSPRPPANDQSHLQSSPKPPANDQSRPQSSPTSTNDQSQPQYGNTKPVQSSPPPANDQSQPQSGNTNPVQSSPLPTTNGPSQPQSGNTNLFQSSPPPPTNGQSQPQSGNTNPVQSSPPPANGPNQPQSWNTNPVQSSPPPPTNGQNQHQSGIENPVQSSPLPPANDQSRPQSGNTNHVQSSSQPATNVQRQPGNPGSPVQSEQSNSDSSQTQTGSTGRQQGQRRPGRQKRFIEDLDFNFTNTRREFEDDAPKKRRPAGRKSNLRELRKEFNYLFSSHDRETRISMGHELSDILVSCTFSGVVCNISQFQLQPTSTYGNCYTLENPDFISYKSGPSDGLELILYLEIDEYIPTIASGNGVQIQIHETNTWPEPEIEGMAISAAAETNIAMRMIQIDRLSRPYGFCNNGEEFQARYGRKYTRQTCQLFCVQERIVSECGCYDEEKYELQMNLRPEVGVENISACHEKEEVQCMLSVESDWETGVFSCTCYNPCFETSYHIISNSRSWPSDSYARILVQHLCYNKNDTECERYEKMDPRTLSENFMKINIYFDDLNYERITETPNYEDVQFLSDIGGTVGLWVGLSVLSFAEVGQFFMEIVRFLFHYTSNRKIKSAHRIHVRGNSLETNSTVDPTRPPSSHPFAETNKKLYFH